jgi:RND family efflux transporter MFP subunit
VRPLAAIVTGLAVAALAAAGGYWLGSRGAASPAADSGGSVASTTGETSAAGRKEPRILYYRNPMGLPDTSPVPKKDSMGMDYIPVREGEDDADPAAARQLRISTEKVQKLGVRSEAVQLRALDRTLRAAGRIEPDERRVHAIAPRFEGYVERLYVNVSGQPVARGQPLFEVYSPELVAAQREYAIAAQGVESLHDGSDSARSGMQELAAASLSRLRNWGVAEDQLAALARSGDARRTISFRSPVAGIVTEKKAVQGMRFMPGETLYQVTDLSSVWVIADVFEQDIALVRTGGKARVTINAHPGKHFEGVVAYVYPTLNAETRTVPVRIELANPGLLLKPSMFAQVELPLAARAAVPSVPVSAVIDSGTRQIVLIRQAEGRFEPRAVRLGVRSDDYVEVLAGVSEGEQVVVAANFLIDAESNLRAAVAGLGPTADGAAGKASERGDGGRPANKGAGHRGEGTVDSVDAPAATVTLRHGPIDSLKWPAMTMPFKLANQSLLQGLQPGGRIAFDFVERQPGEWVITAHRPLPAGQDAGAAAATGNPHAGH